MTRNLTGFRKPRKNDSSDAADGGNQVMRGRPPTQNGGKHQHDKDEEEDGDDDAGRMLKSFFTSWLPKLICLFLLVVVGAVSIQGYYARTLFTYVTDNSALTTVMFSGREYIFLCTDTRGTDGAKKEAPLPDWYYKLAKAFHGVSAVVDCSSNTLTKSRKSLYETFPSIAKFKHVPPVMFYGVGGTVTGINTDVFRRKTVDSMIAHVTSQNQKRFGLMDSAGSPTKIKTLCKEQCVLWLTKPNNFPFLQHIQWQHVFLDGARFEVTWNVANIKADEVGKGILGAVIWETSDGKRNVVFVRRQDYDRVESLLTEIVEDPAFVASKRGTLLKTVGGGDWMTVSAKKQAKQQSSQQSQQSSGTSSSSGNTQRASNRRKEDTGRSSSSTYKEEPRVVGKDVDVDDDHVHNDDDDDGDAIDLDGL